MSAAKKTNVVRLHNNPPVEWESTYQVCSLLQSKIANYISSGGKINKIATKTNLGHQTISKIAYGETKASRAETVLRLLHHFGGKVHIQF